MAKESYWNLIWEVVNCKKRQKTKKPTIESIFVYQKKTNGKYDLDILKISLKTRLDKCIMENRPQKIVKRGELYIKNMAKLI